ncbi:MAG: hypothetical protein JW861_08410 [Bacteroidales bacterium]|nr:hypothetical protein [Bacteroidales bacterium]
MKKAIIPADIQEKANRIIDRFNESVFQKGSENQYHAKFQGAFLYLYRREGDADGPVARLTYTGDFERWEFAIFRWSVERYDPGEDEFPGFQYLDGTIEGAIKAGHAAYPPDWSPFDPGVGKGGLFFDDGTPFNPDLYPKPELCLTCMYNNDGDPEEQLLCNLNRMGQLGADDFICHAYKKKRK